MKPKMTRRRAFTLVEILVVVGIIALLAGISFPVFNRVREGGRRTICTNNMRQLGLAFGQYVQDSSGRYPLAGQLQLWNLGAHWATGGEGGVPKSYTGVLDTGNSASNTPEKAYGLADPGTFKYIEGHEAYPEQGALYPYVKSPTPYVCPSAKDGDKKRLSYSMNCAVAGINTVRIKKPAEIILLVDEGDSINDAYFWASNTTSSTDSLFKGHNGGGNILLADGSVRFYPFDKFPADKDHGSLKVATTGEVRFRDTGFGAPYTGGANYVPAINPMPNPAPPGKPTNQQNTCSEGITFP